MHLYTYQTKAKNCSCLTVSTNYPTAAISTLAYSGTSSQMLGVGLVCGRCFKITLTLAHTATPPFILANWPDKPTPLVMVKIVDKCPLDVALYGYDDFESVSNPIFFWIMLHLLPCVY
ncbi:hypothetical protein CROQUDRAFT_525347 [Cronartium quercuum f. sp. fusiforme G11]|uniref:Expansin-like EG45 domain-containing protein n=1 Tax=Cronartium quercuum f. sp. fusiforme G11 TaxID=708437 RepID=A0A9P6TC48_9BASI|nr:hypothetical protein CROQUDRAFT_525347 [Cronartium quercuum f. sp. fusiforme G11]